MGVLFHLLAKAPQNPGILDIAFQKMAENQRGSGCYATFITNDDYFAGAQVLLKTLHSTRTSYPICVLVGPEVSDITVTRLNSLASEVLRVENISSNCESTSSWAHSQYTKLNIWNLTQYEKVVYIDADCIVMDNVDESDFAACPDIFPPDKFNAGVLVIRPSIERFQWLVSNISRLSSYDGGDTGDANSRLPFRYNAQRTMYWFTHSKEPGYWESIQPVKIIHYSSSPKPWQVAMGKGLGDLELLWWQKCMGF